MVSTLTSAAFAKAPMVRLSQPLSITLDSVRRYGSKVTLLSGYSEGMHMAEQQNGRRVLFAGGLAALLASTCCLGPLVLVALGVSGAWIGNLTLLEPYRPVFIGAALVALFFAGRRIFRPAAAC